MATAILQCSLVLLIYLRWTYGQQAPGINNGMNNAILQQQAAQRPNNINQFPNGGLNINLAQQPNSPPANLQQAPNLSGKQGNMQLALGLPPNSQSQSASLPQNGFQITKMAFTPVSQGVPNNPAPTAMQCQNAGPRPQIQPSNLQVMTPPCQNVPMSNPPISKTSNAPFSTTSLADLAALRSQSSLLSLLSPQNNCQQPQNQQVFLQNQIPAQNQLTDEQKQFLVRSLQGQTPCQNQQGHNVIQSQPIVTNIDNQQALAYQAMQGAQQPIVTTLGNQPAYITVQAQPLTTYLQNQSPQVVVEEEPSIASLIMSELGPQYAVNNAYSAPKKESSLKTLIPLIINLLKEKNSCGCRNCGCPPNNCQQSDPCPAPMPVLPPIPGFDMAQIYGGYSNQKMYGQPENPSRIQRNDDDEARSNDKPKQTSTANDSDEESGEDDSEYDDD